MKKAIIMIALVFGFTLVAQAQQSQASRLCFDQSKQLYIACDEVKPSMALPVTTSRTVTRTTRVGPVTVWQSGNIGRYPYYRASISTPIVGATIYVSRRSKYARVYQRGWRLPRL
ncbi:MAG: hypothetical protein R3B41_00070 [Candidatus Doudnabacteria bacterium]